ncbi:hypothetical protein [Paenibacillus dokdonensis]|uniref:hypothetical protein n=1 Tax=Paenibacillus dokdonensis TaxID=2567944 RepID=UPI0010A76FF8|nr:hypothetical protein [Paenibacillus dokdonensis]
MRSNNLVDPLFQDVPWDIVYNEDGQQIGEVYVLLGKAKKEATPYDPVHGIRRTGRTRKTKSINSYRIR